MPAAQAISIQYQLTALGGNSYLYEYTVENDGSLGSGVPVKVFDILFDPVLYDETSLTPDSPPAITADWTEQIFYSAPGGLPAAYDVQANTGGLPDGATLSGFAVKFTWLGGASSLPGAQLFEIYDADTFDLLEIGQTTPAGEEPPPTVPEPPVIGLLAWGVLALLARRRRSSVQ